MKTTAKSVAYWTITGALVLSIGSGGIAELAHRPETIDGMKALGYPVYFVMIIGFWKIGATLALLAPRLPRLKEWAYAGVFFNMTGAAVSHVVCRSESWHVVVMLILIALTVSSWALRPATRRLMGEKEVPSRASIPSVGSATSVG